MQKYLREEVDNGERLTVTQVTCKRFTVNGTELLGVGVIADGGAKQGTYVLVSDDDGDSGEWFWMIQACPLPKDFPQELVMFCEEPA